MDKICVLKEELCDCDYKKDLIIQNYQLLKFLPLSNKLK